MVYSTAAGPHIIRNVLTCHGTGATGALWQLRTLLLFSSEVIAAWCFCLCLHVCLHICGGKIKELGRERRTSTLLSPLEADSSVYHASTAAHLGSISLMFANFLFRWPACGAGPRGVTVCAIRCITGSLGCQKVMSIMSWITNRLKSWWTFPTDCNAERK